MVKLQRTRTAVEARRQAAEARQAQYNALSTEQKLERLEARIGSTGAVKERARLTP